MPFSPKFAVFFSIFCHDFLLSLAVMHIENICKQPCRQIYRKCEMAHDQDKKRNSQTSEVESNRMTKNCKHVTAVTSVKTDDAVLQDNIGTSDTGLCQFVAANDAI